MNLQFGHLSKNMPTPTFGNGSGIQKIPQKVVQVSPLAKETISVLRNFCNHPEKGGKMSQKQSASACTRILVVFIL